MNINLIIVANFFSETLVKISSHGNMSIIYRAHSKNKILKAFTLFLVLIISWFTRLIYGLTSTLYIPHSYNRFGLIIKYCCYDNLVLIDDGVAFLSAQEFQNKYIFPIAKHKNFKKIVACDDNLLHLQKDLDVKIDTVTRSEVMKKMLNMQKKASKYKIYYPHILIIDNGIWSNKDINNVVDQVKREFDLDVFLALHPVRNNKISLGTELDVPIESWWFQNKRYITGIVSSFSTGALNIKSISNELEIYFVPPHTNEHLVTIKRLNGKIL